MSRQPEDILAALKSFLETREGARRFHPGLIGKVDPHYCLGDFLSLVAADRADLLEKRYGSTRTKTALSGSAGGNFGGYLVPQELRHDLFVSVQEASFFRTRALVVPMTTTTLQLDLPDATTVQAAGVAPFVGGLQLKWTPEAATRPESEFKVRQLTLRAADLTGYGVFSNNLIADAGPGFEAALRRLLADACAWYEDYAFFQGSGVGQPTGVVNASAAIQVTRNASSNFKDVDAEAMLGDLLPQSYETACWVVAPTVMPKLPALTGWQSNQPPDGRSGSAKGVLHGLPLFVSSKLPPLGTLGDVMLMDPRLYVIGDRMSLEVAFTGNVPTLYANNQGAFRLLERVDGQPWFSSTITLPDASTAVSPYVVLK